MAARPGPGPAGVDVEDLELIRRIAAGERPALDLLYDRHAPWLTVRLRRRCASDDLVDTAVQDTFVSVWRQAARSAPERSVGGWLWTIGLRRLIDLLRKRPSPVPVDPTSSLAEVVATEVPLALGHTAVGQAFAALAADHQAVLVATVLDGLTTAEAAALLGVRPGTVKSRAARARAQLERELGAIEATEGGNP